MSVSLLLPPTTQVVSQTISATGPGTVFSLKIGESYLAELLVTTSAGTVDVALQHSANYNPANPAAATWTTLPLKFGQSATASATASSVLAFKPAIGLSDAAAAYTPALTGAAVAANIPFNVKAVRPYVTLGTAGTTNFTINFTIAPKGTVVQ